MDIFSKNSYFYKEVTMLRVCGISVKGGESRLYLIYTAFVFFALLVNYAALDTWELFKHEFSVNADIIIYHNATFMTIAKASAVLKNRHKIRELLTRLQGKPFVPNPGRGGQVEENLIKECVWLTHLQSTSYWVAGVTTMVAAIIFTLFKRIRSSDPSNWQFAFGPFTVLDVTVSPIFEISWMYQNITILYIGLIFTSVDVLIAAILAHISYQFKILQNYIKNIVEISRKQSGAKPHWKALHESLNEAVEYHNQILSIAEELEEAFNVMILFTFLGTLTLICFSVYNASTYANGLKIIMYIGQIFCATFQIFVVCYWSEQVRQESQNVGFSVYDCDFTSTDIRFQKMLVLLIRRSQNPTKLTVGKFTDVGIATFAWIIRSSYSALMILRRN